MSLQVRAEAHFWGTDNTLEKDIKDGRDRMTPAVASTLNCEGIPAQRCMGEGIRLFVGLINENADTAVEEALKLKNHGDVHIAVARGLAIVFRDHGVTGGEEVRAQLSMLETLQDDMIYPGGEAREEEE